MDFFPEKPWACKCGSGFDSIDVELEQRLNVARFFAGIPFTITSACRCKSHNLDVGGAEKSAHLFGSAADIECITNYQRGVILPALFSAGFRRIGVAKKFVHADVQPGEAIWLY
jgi:uncharacterized protein YcbK (DUF882 family)